MSRQYFVRDRGRTMGPFTYDQLFDMRDRGQLQAWHEVSTDQRTWKAFDIMFSGGGSGGGTRTDAPAPNPQKGMRKPPPGGNKAVMIVAASVGGLVVVAGIVLGVILLARGRTDSTTPGSVPEGVINITPSTSDTDRGKMINGTVGLVITGTAFTSRQGDEEEIPYFPGVEDQERQAGTGTGFLVDSDGHVVTNYHVVENYDRYRRSSALDEARRRFKSVEPKLWVFFGPDNKKEATLVHTSDKYDLAVLKITGAHPRWFALGYSENDSIPSYSRVFAFGYPSDDQRAISEMKGTAKRKLPPGSKIERYFEREDFLYTPTNGGAKRNLKLDPFNKGEAWYLNHEAHTIQGNSGGPLVAWDGTVIGINTLIRSKKLRAGGGEVIQINEHGQNFALTMSQLRNEIDRAVPGAVKWRKLPD